MASFPLERCVIVLAMVVFSVALRTPRVHELKKDQTTGNWHSC